MVEKTVRENGAVPATCAIIGGRLKAGLSEDEIEYLERKGREIRKASRRDLGVLVARGEDGATTVTTTMMIASLAAIGIFATGGIGGVHRGAEKTMDISADLEELARILKVRSELGLKGGVLITNPIPEEYSMDKAVIDAAIDKAIKEADENGIHGKELTPFLLARIKDLTGGESLESNIELVLSNARLAAKTAVALSQME